MSIFGIVAMRKARYDQAVTSATETGRLVGRLEAKLAAADELDGYAKGYVDALALGERPVTRQPAGRHLRLVGPDDRAPAAS